MIEAEYIDFSQMLENEFLKLYYEYCEGKPQNRIAHIIDSFWIDLHDIIFKPSKDEIIFNRCKSRLLPYKVYDIESVVNMYIKLCYRYGGVIKIESVINLLGYNRQTFYNWNKWNNSNDYIFKVNDSQINLDIPNILILNDKGKIQDISNTTQYSLNELSYYRFDILKRLRDEIKSQNTTDLSNSTVGQVVRANNDEDVGKFYDAKNIMLKQNSVGSLETAADRAKRLGIELKND